MVIAYNGVKQIEAIFGDGEMIELVSYTSMGLSFLTFITYMQQTFENASHDFSGMLTKSLAGLSPFSALQFLYGGIAGSEALNLSFPISMTIGFILYLFRMYSCADSATKTPKMLDDLKTSTKEAINERKYRQFLNMGLALNIACAFSIISFAPARIATTNLLGLLPTTIEECTLSKITFVSAILSTIGSFPLSFYWLLLGIDEVLRFDAQNIPAFIITALLTIQLFGRVNALHAEDSSIEEKALQYFTLITVVSYTLFGAFSNSKRLVSNAAQVGNQIYTFFSPQRGEAQNIDSGYEADDEAEEEDDDASADCSV